VVQTADRAVDKQRFETYVGSDEETAGVNDPDCGD